MDGRATCSASDLANAGPSAAAPGWTSRPGQRQGSVEPANGYQSFGNQSAGRRARAHREENRNSHAAVGQGRCHDERVATVTRKIPRGAVFRPASRACTRLLSLFRFFKYPTGSFRPPEGATHVWREVFFLSRPHPADAN